MKYIRTKDGCITEGNFEIGKTIATLYGDEQITKENTADTIEELCDEFVRSYKGYCRLLDLSNENPKKIFLEYSKYKMPERVEIFGAIWTDKGLIYVAKLNERGELELI